MGNQQPECSSETIWADSSLVNSTVTGNMLSCECNLVGNPVQGHVNVVLLIMVCGVDRSNE